METKASVLNGKPDAGNLHVRFDEGEVASMATPRRGSLLYKCLVVFVVLVSAAVARGGDKLAAPSAGDVHLDGFAGEKIARFLDWRVRGDFARNVIFPEARHAFEEPDDDTSFTPGKGDCDEKYRVRPWGRWKGEFWGKLMLSACRVAEYEHDGGLKDCLREEALRLIAFQKPDGYLGTYVDPEYVQPICWKEDHADTTTKGAWCWNLWCRKYTMWGLLANWKLTGDWRMLDAAARSMDQEIAMLNRMGLRPIDTGTFCGMPSSSVLKPLMMLYNETGKKRYIDFAKTIVDDFRRHDGRAPNIIANALSGKPVADWYPAPWAWAKVYEMLSCCEGLLEYYRITGDESILNAMVRFHDLVAKHELNACFSVGYNDQFANAASLPDCITELCDAIHWIRFNRELWLITGEAKYVDAIELAFYNAYLAGIGRDGKWGARGVRSHGYHHVSWHGQSGLKHQHCCVDNVPRCAVDVAQTMVARDKHGVLYIALYNDGRASVGDDKVEISGNYPVGDSVTVKIVRKTAGTVRFRIPAWSACDADRGTWRTVEVPAGESVHRFSFDLRPRVRTMNSSGTVRIEGNDNTQDWRRKMWTGYGADKDLLPFMRTSPSVEIMRGPLLLAKAAVAGTPALEIAESQIIYGSEPSLRLEPARVPGTWGAWALVIEDESPRRVPVCDFISAGDEFKSPGICFSLWF